MARRQRCWLSLGITGILAWPVMLGACGDGQHVTEAGNPLEPTEVQALLVQLPYSFTFADVQASERETGVVRGRATSSRGTVLDFGIALGKEAAPVSVGRAGTRMAYGYPSGGFVYTDDLMVENGKGALIPNPQFKSYAQWRQAGHMGVAITAKLCKAATGRPCPP